MADASERTLTIVLPIWVYNNPDEPREWYRDLGNMLDTLEWQTEKVDEVIVVNMGPSRKNVSRIKNIVESHDVVHIEAPRDKFNMSWAFNVGVVRATSTYIATIGYEMLFSQGSVAAMKKYMKPHRILGGCCGFLNPQVDLSDPISDWDEIYATMEYQAGSSRKNAYRGSVGTIQVMHRDQWHKMRGYNEKFGFSWADSELVHRAVTDGIKRWMVTCKEAIWLHPWHKPSELVAKSPKPHELSQSSITANPGGWGEI